MSALMRMGLLVVGLTIVALSVAGCQTTMPETALQLPPESIQARQIQTRRFDGISEASLLSACAGVLQDLGFNLDEAEAPLGLIVASKERTALNPATARIKKLLDLFLDIELKIDEEQRIRASLVSKPVRNVGDSFQVRVTFQRIVWTTENEISKLEELKEPELYQQFFDRLSKSVFLEAHSL